MIISILQPGELYYSTYICVPCTFGDNYIMSYSALFYCVFEEINEVLENWWYIIEGEGGLFGDEGHQ